MRLATVVTTPPSGDLAVRFADEVGDPVRVGISAVPVDALEVGDQVQVQVVHRQVVLLGRTGGAPVDPTPPPESITYEMLGPEFHALLEQGATDVVLAQAAVQAGMIAVDAVGEDQIAADSIVGDHIVGRTISGDKIASYSISAADAVFQAAAIKSADIESIVANKITAGTIGAHTIQLSGASSIIQSSNFVAGSQGWRIRGNGDVEFASGTFRGDIIGATITGATITGGTITGGTFRTAQSGTRIEVIGTLGGEIGFYHGSSKTAYMNAGTYGVNIVHADGGWLNVTAMSGTFGGHVSTDTVSTYVLHVDGIQPRFGGEVVVSGGTLRTTSHLEVGGALGVSAGGGISVGTTVQINGFGMVTPSVTIGTQGNALRRVRHGRWSGTTSASGVATISHGLGATPTAVIANPTSPNSGTTFIRSHALDNIGSSSFEVRCWMNNTTSYTGSATIDWIAIY